uniref:C2H2-type domain-containing protein n=1 Tax=Scylla olivacea TaxID=85551 RepID=A0A0P4WMX8_SCYOL
MRDGGRPKVYKSLRGSQNSGRNSPLVETASRSLTQAPLPTLTRSQAGTTTYMPVLQTETLQQASTQSHAQSQVQEQTNNIESHRHIQSHPQSLIHTPTQPVTHGETHNCTQSQTLIQVTPRVLTQALVYSHPQVLPQVHVSTQSEIHSSSRVQSQSHVHTHLQAPTQSQVLTSTQVHTHTQGSTQINNMSSVCTQSQANPPPPPQVPTQAQIYTHSQSQVHTQVPTSQVLTQAQMHTQPQTHTQTHIHIQPQVHTHAQVHAHSHTHMHLHSDSQLQMQSTPSTETHIPVQSQLQPLPIQAQIPALSQVSLSSNLPDLVDTPQIENSSQKNSEGLEVVHIPVSRHHNSSSASLQELHSSSVTMNDVLSSSSHTQLMHTLTAFPLTDTLNNSINIQQNSATLSPALTHSLTQSQILDALSVERLLPSRNSLGQAIGSEGSTVEISDLSAIQGQENFTSCPEQPPSTAVVPSVKESEVSKSIDASNLCASQINSQQISAPQLSNLHLLAEDNVDASLSEKVSTATTTTSSIIASNRMLNKLLDSTKPHIPSQVSKAAEIAHLVPNPTARLSSSSSARSGEIDGAEIAFTVSSCGSNSLSSTRSCMASMCTVTTSVTGASGEMGNKAMSSSSSDSIFNLPTNFPASSATLVVPTSVSHGQIISQRHIDAVHQALISSQSTPNIGEQHLEGLNAIGLRHFSPTSNMSQNPTVSSCSVSNVSNIAIVLPPDKTARKVVSSFQPSNLTKSFNLMGIPEGLSKGGTLLDTSPRFQNGSCTKSGLITSTDPMFTSVAVTSRCSSPASLGSVITTRSGTTSHEGSGRVKAALSDTRVSHQTLVDLLSRAPASDGVVSSGGAGMSLMCLPDSRLPHTSDVLLSELHRSDESDLSLGATLSSTTGEEIHNASGLATEASLVTGMGGDSAPLQELPSPPLSSFNLPNIAGDFMVNEVSGSKNCHPSQAQLSALLSNLPTTDFDRFLDNSNTSMCIDISLSDSEVSLNAESSFTYSPGKSHVHKKSLSTTASELTFTSALKAVTTKSGSEEGKLPSDHESPCKLLNHEQPALVQELPKSLKVNSVSDTSDSLPTQESLNPIIEKTETPSVNISKTNMKIQNKSQSQKGKRKEVLRKNELLVQQVACYKCRLCSFLNQDKNEMVIHMREHHSQYYSDTEESEEEVGQRATSKKVKVLMPQSECEQPEGTSSNHEAKRSVRVNRENNKKNKTNQESTKERSHLVKEENEDVSGKVGMHIKSEPRDVGEFEGCLIDEEEEENAGLTIELGESVGNITGSEQEYAEEDDTNDSTATSESVITTTKVSGIQTSQFPGLKNRIGIKRKNAKKSSDDTASIRCDVNGCGVRMKSETNIIYHRKCHVNSMLQCQECLSTKFQGWRDLALHLWRHHLIDMELHKCDKCDYKSYSYSKLMNVHHKIHSDERPSLCDICGKRFKTPKQLRNHKTLHMKKTEAPQHQCEICHRPFSDKRMLRNHQESVHKKVKPFLCNYCGYSTASRSTLKMHMRQHTGEKPFACEKCKYRTSDHNSLRRHKMQHSGVRPYRCPYCDYASIQSTTFKVHLKDKHPGLAQIDGIMFTCGVCSFKTVKRDNFLAHVAEHSRGEGRKRQPVSPASVSKTEEPQGIYGDLAPSAPHVVNIDVESGTVTVESPQDSDFLSSVHMQAPVPGQVIMAGDKYIYAAVDSSVLSQVRSGERIVQLSQDVVGVPLSLPLETSTASPLQGLVYVATTSQGGQ